MTLYNKINKRLLALNKTEYWLAKQANLPKSLLAKMKANPNKEIYLSTAIKIARALDISLDEFK